MRDALDRGRAARPVNLPRLLSTPASILLAEPARERQWLVQDLLPAGAVTLLSGDGGTGKSVLALHCAASIVAGVPFLGRAVTRSPALYIAAEDDRHELRRRLARIVERMGVTPDALDSLELHDRVGADSSLMTWPDAYSPGEPTGLLVSIQSAAVEMGARLVVLDSLHDFFTGNEINRVVVRQFMSSALRALAIEINGAVLVIQHPSVAGLAEGSGRSGSTGWRNAARSLLIFEAAKGSGDEPPDPDARTLTVGKSNYARTGARLSLRWDDGTFALVEGSDAGNIVDRISRDNRENEARRVFLAALERLLSEGRPLSAYPSAPTFAPKIIAQQPEARGFNKGDLRRAMDDLFADKAIAVGDTGCRNTARHPVRGIIRTQGTA